MAKEKKGQKFGRNSRAPSNRTYVWRAERNKQRKIARFLKNNPNAKPSNHQAGRVGEFPPPVPKTRAEVRAAERVMFTALLPSSRGDHLCISAGVTIEVGYLSDCERARKDAGPHARVFRREGSRLMMV